MQTTVAQQSSKPTVARQVAQWIFEVSLYPFMLVGVIVHHIQVGYAAGHAWANETIGDLMDD